jgi:nucleotide-binding universal stress UspA family protein
VKTEEYRTMHDILSLCAQDAVDDGTRHALALTRVLDGSLTALAVCEPVTEVLALTQPAAAGLLVAWQHERLARARAASDGFAAWARAQGVTRSRWLVAQAPLADAVAHAAAWHDLLVVVARPDRPHGDAGSIGRLLLAGGVPVVVVPDGHSAPPSLDVVAVAWNGAPQATRALHTALPLLRRARRVVLLAGTRRASFDTMIEPPPFDPAAHLAAHGVAFEHCMLDHPDERSGEELLARAEAARANLLVMGAWGRARASELVLGGATRHVLAAARLPVLFRH